MHESELNEKNSFLTLTYDEKNLPEDAGLRVRDWQLFAKRLREKVGRFRFIHCGEYGEDQGRPHYHALLFGQDFSGDREKWALRGGHQTYVSDTASETWGKGNVEIGSVTFESAAYVAGYCLKKLTGTEGETEYSRLDPSTGETWNVRPPYVTMSRRPGLGHEWYKRYKGDCFPSDFVIVNGSKRAVPRYYDKLLEEENPDLMLEMKRRRRDKAVIETPERLKVIEKVHEREYDFFHSAMSGRVPG